uniref:Reverse transcriptase domain-containing protein n=1 Tax=Cannabis sativa TaxID=3483 RepID=A0A803PD65_CANSA
MCVAALARDHTRAVLWAAVSMVSFSDSFIGEATACRLALESAGIKNHNNVLVESDSDLILADLWKPGMGVYIKELDSGVRYFYHKIDISPGIRRVQDNFHGKKGLREGYPLSPLLFVLIMEYSTRRLSMAANQSNFSKVNIQSIQILKDVMNEFYATSGLAINTNKSQIYLGGVDNKAKHAIPREINLTEGKFRLKYLGVPLRPTKWRVEDCDVILKKIKPRLHNWASRHLSFTGRSQLIHSVLLGLHNHWMIIFILPQSITKKIEKLCRGFLLGWNGNRSFQRAVVDCHLHDMELFGYPFTWERGQVSSVQYMVVNEGREMGLIFPTRGLRQGNPLSPYLFLLFAKGFSVLIRKFERQGDLKGCKVANGAPIISHILFIDDSYLYYRANDREAANVLQLLSTFELAFGQKAKYAKSSIFFGTNIPLATRIRICGVLGMEKADESIIYLGLPCIMSRYKEEFERRVSHSRKEGNQEISMVSCVSMVAQSVVEKIGPQKMEFLKTLLEPKTQIGLAASDGFFSA